MEEKRKADALADALAAEAEKLEDKKNADVYLKTDAKEKMVNILNDQIRKLAPRGLLERIFRSRSETHKAKKKNIIDTVNTQIDVYNKVYKDETPINKLTYTDINEINQEGILKALNTILDTINIDINKKGGKLTRKIHKIKSNTVKSTTRKGGRKTNKSKKVSKNRRKTRRKL